MKNFPEEILIAHRINRTKKITAVVFFPLLYQERNKLRLLHLLGNDLYGLFRIKIPDSFQYLDVNDKDKIGIIHDIRLQFTFIYMNIFLQEDNKQQINLKVCTHVEKQILPPIYEDDDYAAVVMNLNKFFTMYLNNACNHNNGKRRFKQVLFEVKMPSTILSSSQSTATAVSTTPRTTTSTTLSSSSSSSQSTTKTTTNTCRSADLLTIQDFILYNGNRYITPQTLPLYINHLQHVLIALNVRDINTNNNNNNITLYPKNHYLYGSSCMSGRLFIQQSLHSSMVAHQHKKYIRNFYNHHLFRYFKILPYWPATIDMINMIDNRLMNDKSSHCHGLRIDDGCNMNLSINDHCINNNAILHLLRSICHIQISDIYRMLDNHIVTSIDEVTTNKYKSLMQENYVDDTYDNMMIDHDDNCSKGDCNDDDNYDDNNDDNKSRKKRKRRNRIKNKDETSNLLNQCNLLLGLSSSEHSVSDLVQAIFNHVDICYTMIGTQLTQGKFKRQLPMIYNTDKDCDDADGDDVVDGDREDGDNQSYSRRYVKKKRKFEKDHYHDQMPSSTYSSIEEVIQLLIHVTKKNPSNSTYHHDGIEPLLMCNSTHHTCKIVSLLLHSIQAAQRRNYPLLSSDAMIQHFEVNTRTQKNKGNLQMKASLAYSNMNDNDAGNDDDDDDDIDDGADNRNNDINKDNNNTEDDDNKAISIANQSEDDEYSCISLKRKVPIGLSSFHSLQFSTTYRYKSVKKPRNIKRNIQSRMQISQLCNQHTSLFTNESHQQIDDFMPSADLLKYIKQMSDSKLYKHRHDKDRSSLHKKFDSSSLIAIAILVEEMLRESIQTFSTGTSDDSLDSRSLRLATLAQLNNSPNIKQITTELLQNRLEAVLNQNLNSYSSDIKLYHQVAIKQEEEQQRRNLLHEDNKLTPKLCPTHITHIDNIDNDKSIGFKSIYKHLPSHILNIRNNYYNSCQGFEKYDAFDHCTYQV